MMANERSGATRMVRPAMGVQHAVLEAVSDMEAVRGAKAIDCSAAGDDHR